MGSGAEIRYYHHDNLGSLRMMTDKAGNWEQDYLPFGEGDTVLEETLQKAKTEESQNIAKIDRMITLI